MKIYLIRHGQTSHNALKIYSSEDQDLNEVGIKQVNELKNKIKEIDYDVIITSPLKRTIHTTNIINIKNKEVIIDERLKERSVGDLSGKPLSVTNRDEYWNYNTKIKYGTSEDIKIFFTRVYEFLNELKTKNYKNVLIVAHSGISKAFSGYFEGINDGMFLNRGLKNCEIKEYIFDNKFKTIKNNYYEIYYPIKYENYIKEVLDYSTNKLIENLSFFNQKFNGDTIKASFFDNKNDFFARIKKLDPTKTPPNWAKGCFYGNENQILIDSNDILSSFYTLAHETCHLLFQRFIYNNYSNRIVWLDESFACIFSLPKDKIDNKDKIINIIRKYNSLKDIPNINNISFENKNIKTKEYDAYDFFQIIGYYLISIYSKEELLLLYKDEEKVIKLGETILNDSMMFFREKYNL